MIKIARLTFNPFGENTYILHNDSKECIIVDAGNYSAAEDRALSEFIKKNALTPVLAVNTHGHVDHILGVSYVKKTYNIPFAVHADDRFLIDSAAEHGAMYGFNICEIPSIDIDLKGEQEIRFGESTLQIIHTPGHSPGHICLYNKENGIMLTGDTLFKESIGRTDLPGGDYGQIMQSIIDKILPLGEGVRFFPGHGSDSTLGHEALYNPFITEVLGGEVKPR